MLTRRKKQNIFIFVIGLVIGVIIAGLLSYFNVIKRIVEVDMSEIHAPLTANKSDTIVVVNKPKQIQSKSKESKIDTESDYEICEDDVSLSESDTLIEMDEMEAIQMDTKIAEEMFTIFHLETGTGTISYDELPLFEIKVEQWENPTNFAGYRKHKNTLIVYGVSLDEIEVQYINGVLCLVYKNNQLPLIESKTFIRFPSSFGVK